MPVALSCSYAVMLPVGTPPNAIVSGIASIPTKEMVRHFLHKGGLKSSQNHLQNPALVETDFVQ